MIYIDPTPLTNEEMARKYGDGIISSDLGYLLANKSEKAVDYGVTVSAAILGAMIAEGEVPPLSWL